jgi:hypothetical protein
MPPPYHQQAFDKTKRVVETEVLLKYLDFNEPFHIFTDSSFYQLSVVMVQGKNDIP